MSPAVAFAPPLPLLGAEPAASIPCLSEAPASSPPEEWRCWATVRWSEGEVGRPLGEGPMAREEAAEELEVEEMASAVVYTEKLEQMLSTE